MLEPSPSHFMENMSSFWLWYYSTKQITRSHPREEITSRFARKVLRYRWRKCEPPKARGWKKKQLSRWRMLCQTWLGGLSSSTSGKRWDVRGFQSRWRPVEEPLLGRIISNLLLSSKIKANPVTCLCSRPAPGDRTNRAPTGSCVLHSALATFSTSAKTRSTRSATDKPLYVTAKAPSCKQRLSKQQHGLNLWPALIVGKMLIFYSSFAV